MNFLTKKAKYYILLFAHKLFASINIRTDLRYYRFLSNNNDLLRKHSLEIPTLPHGVNLHFDLSRLMPRWENPVSVFLDEGSNIGDTTQELLFSYSNFKLYCFEPVLSSFEKIRTDIL